MMRSTALLTGLMLLPATALAGTVGTTTALAPFAGHYAAQTNIGFYGTDLGYSVYDGTNIRFYFGDSWSNNMAASICDDIGCTMDDALGVLSGSSFPTGSSVDTYIQQHPTPPGFAPWRATPPPIAFQLDAFGFVASDRLYHGGLNGTLLSMTLGHTPMAAFANRLSGAAGAVFAIFNLVKPKTCSNNACSEGYTCDTGMGTCFPQLGIADIPCVMGTTRCACLAVSGGGLCQDRTSSVYANTEDGRALSVVLAHEVGNADRNFNPNIREVHYSKTWNTNKFMDPAAATVKDFDPGRVNGSGNNYVTADGTGSNQKVFLWGRPGFVGYGSWTQKSAKVYFAYADMPSYSSTGNFTWNVHYFSGMGSSAGCTSGGLTGSYPCFSSQPTAASALDLKGTMSGLADTTAELYDIVNQVTVAYVPQISQWVMLYGGDQTDGGLDLFAGPNWTHIVRDPDRAIHARFASQPWGPWSVPQQVLKAGNPLSTPPTLQFAPGGILFDNHCSGSTCAAGEPFYDPTVEYGHLYAPNIVDKWTTARTNPTGADIYWTVSTGNPYETVLMRTRVTP
jgi:hypothetical protein